MLPELEYDSTQHAMRRDPMSRNSQVLYAKFYTHPTHDKKASEAAGRPIFKDTAYIEIRTPGSKTTVINRPARQRDLDEFPRQWDAYQKGHEEVVEGTPLEEWPQLTRSQVEEFKAMGVRSVEQLAAMPDTNVQRFMGGHRIKQRAKDYIEAAESEAPLIQLREENDKLRSELEVLKDQMAQLMSAKAEED